MFSLLREALSCPLKTFNPPNVMRQTLKYISVVLDFAWPQIFILLSDSVCNVHSGLENDGSLCEIAADNLQALAIPKSSVIVNLLKCEGRFCRLLHLLSISDCSPKLWRTW